MNRTTMFVVVLSFAAFGLQACFYRSSSSGQYGHYSQYQAHHTVCDVNGNNCLACDADDNNCRRVDTAYGSNRMVCDAQGCVSCDANNTNCRSEARNSWGFFF
jgi:hypothetical protein